MYGSSARGIFRSSEGRKKNKDFAAWQMPNPNEQITEAVSGSI
jgi:hypothetical protein